MKYAILFLLAFLSCTPELPMRYTNANEQTISIDDFLADALFNGMRKDGFPEDLAKDILANEAMYFVPKCPICTPVKRGISQYLNEKPSKAKEILVPEAMLIALKGAEKTAKQEALGQLVDRYTTWHLEGLHMSEAGKERLMGKLKVGRKQGMSGKSENFGKFCPSCDGACKVKRD